MKRPLLRIRAIRFAALALLVLPLSCSSVSVNPEHMQECQCGTPEFDVMGCAAQCAIDGPQACGNPLCTCEPRDGQD